MEPVINSRIEFLQRYWNYYIILEKDFLEVERYLAIDEINFGAYSNEYIKQYQAICSEIDVISKSYCKELDSNFRGSSINTYCKCISDNTQDFKDRAIEVVDKDLCVFPWMEWTYSVEERNGRAPKIVSNNPDWWQKYNKIKHSRTTINSETGLPYYKLANQKNVLHSLAALFQLELYYYRLLRQNHFPDDCDMPGPRSKLFKIQNWGNRWVMAGADIGFRVAE